MHAGFLHWGSLLPLGLAALLLLGSCSGSSSHSMRDVIAMWGPDQGLLQYIYLGFLDDQLFIGYDGNSRTVLPRVPWMKKVEEDQPDFWTTANWGASHLKKKLTAAMVMLQKHSNQTGEFYIFQRIGLCELSEDGQIGGLIRYGYDGRDVFRYEKGNLTWMAADTLVQVLKEGWDAELAILQHSEAFLVDQCTEMLQRFLGYRKESLLRTEPPVVKVVRKASYDSLETHVCRAHGFFPKEVAISWRKDGEVWEEDTFHGGVTPNSDGTYHTWLSIQMNPKDRDHYQCHVEHTGLLSPLDVAWKESASVWPIVGSISGAVAALLLVSGILLFLSRQMKQWGASKAASRSDPPCPLSNVTSMGGEVWGMEEQVTL